MSRIGTPDFWWSDPSIAAHMLRPAAALYGFVSGQKMGRSSRYTATIPVICVGNFVVGGAGKTPVALALADCFQNMGLVPGFLSRGYGGTLAGPVIVEPHRHTALEVGDEPLLLAERAKTIVARDRVAGARALEQAGIDVIVLDDGFQNPSLSKTQSWIVVDGTVGIGNGLCMPAGPLRVPMEKQVRQTDRIVVLGEGPGREAMRTVCQASDIELVAASLVPSIEDGLRDQPLLGFCGIGRPRKFFDTLADAGLTLVGEVEFGDHHVVSEAEARALLRRAEIDQAILVTTAKDLVRMKNATGEAQRELASKSVMVPVTCQFDDRDLVRRRLLEAMRHSSDRSIGAI